MASTSPTTTAASALNPYKESMRGLLRYVGITGYDVSTAEGLSQPTTGRESVYFEWSESPAWKSFVANIPREERHRASVRRRLSRSLWSAAQRNICLWCWFTTSMCFCAELERYRAELLLYNISSLLEITMVLHAEEVMRSTNSGHIAAYILGAPIRVWGVEDDDLYINGLLPEEEEEEAHGHRRFTVSLYPEKDAVSIENFVRNLQQGDNVGKRVHLLLSDGTWGQATALNRHIPRRIPRVALKIDESYDSLFKALRKKTRDTGVSTLEATSMAIELCLNACDCRRDDADASRQILTSSMKAFVDLQCLMKFQDACFTQGSEAVELVVKKRDSVRRAEALKSLQKLNDKAKNDPEARKLLLPPVLNYCYACDVFVGWFRMPEHAFGKSHLEELKRIPSFYPSEYSRDQVLYAYRKSLSEKESTISPDDTEMD